MLKDCAGHRLRIRKKFLASLGDELHDYELLEILLFAAHPRQDTKALAKRLINQFGDLTLVINADLDRLRDVEGIGEAAITQIKVVNHIIKRVLQKRVSAKMVLKNWQSVLDYGLALLKNLSYEAFHVLFLDKKFQLIADEVLSRGENDQVLVSNKIIAKKALILQASSVVLMHNHPSGNHQPSAPDIKTTNAISQALAKLEIKILDHLIISPNGYFSFKAEGLL